MNRSTDSSVFPQATLCSMKGCMRAMVAQLKSDSEDLQQVNLPVKIFSAEVIITLFPDVGLENRN